MQVYKEQHRGTHQEWDYGIQSFSPGPQCYSSGSKFSILPPAVVMMRARSAASFQLPATCKTTVSKKVAGTGERSMQGSVTVWHLQRPPGTLGDAAFNPSGLQGGCTLRVGPKGSPCWSNSQPVLQLSSVSSRRAGSGLAAARPCCRAPGWGLSRAQAVPPARATAIWLIRYNFLLHAELIRALTLANLSSFWQKCHSKGSY